MATTPQNSRQKANCTAVADRLHADAFVICRAGSVVALHFYTRSGEVIVTVAEKEFVQEARGECDHNGNPWRKLPDADQRDRVLLADAAAVPANKYSRVINFPEQRRATPVTPRRTRDPEITDKFLAVQAMKDSGSPLNFVQLCKLGQVNYGTFMVWRSESGLTQPKEAIL